MVATGWPAGKSTVRFSRLSVTSVPLRVLRRGIVPEKRGQEPIAKWPGGCLALLVPDPFFKAAQLPACDSTVQRLPCCSRLFLGLEELQCHLPNSPYDPD
jgi:hypothetical protein